MPIRFIIDFIEAREVVSHDYQSAVSVVLKPRFDKSLEEC